MGRACDCCGDDEVACEFKPLCFDCYGAGCSEVSEIDIDTISIIVLNHNLDDKTQNNCDSDDCDFVDARYDIYIGPAFIGSISDNSELIKNKKDELKYSTKIGTTAPFRSSNSCDSFDPVCKCIRSDYYDAEIDLDSKRFYSNTCYELFDESGQRYKEIDENHPVILDCENRIRDVFRPYVKEYSGYPIISSSYSACKRLGGQFIYDDDCTIDGTDGAIFTAEFFVYSPLIQPSPRAFSFRSSVDVQYFASEFDIFKTPDGDTPNNGLFIVKTDQKVFGPATKAEIESTITTSEPVGEFCFYPLFDPRDPMMYNSCRAFIGPVLIVNPSNPSGAGEFISGIQKLPLGGPTSECSGPIGAPFSCEGGGDLARAFVPEAENLAYQLISNVGATAFSDDCIDQNSEILSTCTPVRYCHYTAGAIVGVRTTGAFFELLLNGEKLEFVNTNFSTQNGTTLIDGTGPQPVICTYDNVSRVNFVAVQEYEDFDYDRHKDSPYVRLDRSKIPGLSEHVWIVDFQAEVFPAAFDSSTLGPLPENLESWADLYESFAQQTAYYSKDLSFKIGREVFSIPSRNLSKTFDPSIEPQIPETSRTQVSVTIAATSEKAVEYLRKIINDPENTEDCDEVLCGIRNNVGSIDLKNEIQYALNNNNVIIYDKQIIKDISTKSCKTLKEVVYNDYRWRYTDNAWREVETDRFNRTSLIDTDGFGIYLSSDSVFNGRVDIYNAVIKNYVGSIGDLDSYTRININDLSGGLILTGSSMITDHFSYITGYSIYKNIYRNPLEYFECAYCTLEEIIALKKDYNKQFKGFGILTKCDPNDCCVLKENIGQFKLKIIRPELDYEGKEPALYRHYYFFPNDINFDDLSFNFSSQDEVLNDCHNFDCIPYILLKDLILYFLQRAFFGSVADARTGNTIYLVDDERLMPDCLYDFLVDVRTTFYPIICGSFCRPPLASYLATFEEVDFDNTDIRDLSIVSGTTYGLVYDGIDEVEPSIVQTEQGCVGQYSCPPESIGFFGGVVLGSRVYGGLSLNEHCGVIGTGYDVKNLGVWRAFANTGPCYALRKINTRPIYYSEAGSTSYAIEGYCNPEQDDPIFIGGFGTRCACTKNGDSALKKTTTIEWLDKSVGHACGNMLWYDSVSGRWTKWETLPDARKQYNRDVDVLRIKDAEYKASESELDFSKAQEVQDGDGNTFFYIQGESIESFFDTSKIDMSNAAELIQQSYDELKYRYRGYPGNLLLNTFFPIIGADTIGLGTGLELRYSFVDSEIHLQLIYPSFLQGYSIDYVGKTLDIFGSRRCADDCCTGYGYNPPAIHINDEFEYEVATRYLPELYRASIDCTEGGEGVDGSIKNEKGYNAGFDYFRKTALYTAAAATVPDSYNLNKITMRVINIFINCGTFQRVSIGDFGMEEIINRFSADNNFSFNITAGDDIPIEDKDIIPSVPSDCFNPLTNVNEGNELCPAAMTGYFSDRRIENRTFKSQDQVYKTDGPPLARFKIQTELIRELPEDLIDE